MKRTILRICIALAAITCLQFGACKSGNKNRQPAGQVDSFNREKIVALLDTILHSDQDIREQLVSIGDKSGYRGRVIDSLVRIMRMNDSVNMPRIEHILNEYGWLGPDVVGNEGNATIFLVIQHAGIKTQDKYLPMMREAVKQKKASPADLAFLEDRVALAHGKKQVYGSQVTSDPNGSFLAPLIDPDNVDKRRAKAGLGPIAENLKYFGITWDLEAYKKQLPELEKRQSRIISD